MIASNFGRRRHPGWYHNLLANPEVTIRSEGRQWRALARLASEPEHEAIWSRGCTFAPGWRKHERRAGGRVIEAFILDERR